MFEEWLKGFEDMGMELDDDQLFIAKEAYKFGLNRGFDCLMDKKLAEEVVVELQLLNNESDQDCLDNYE